MALSNQTSFKLVALAENAKHIRSSPTLQTSQHIGKYLEKYLLDGKFEKALATDGERTRMLMEFSALNRSFEGEKPTAERMEEKTGRRSALLFDASVVTIAVSGVLGVVQSVKPELLSFIPKITGGLPSISAILLGMSAGLLAGAGGLALRDKKKEIKSQVDRIGVFLTRMDEFLTSALVELLSSKKQGEPGLQKECAE